jgi:uncharacterized membrane protein YdbT with pleckstrin-like domain
MDKGGAMGYIESNLSPGETVVYRTRRHWVVFFWPAVFLMGALWAFQKNEPDIGKFLVLVSGIMGFFAFLDVWTSEFGVTTKRVLIKVGVLRRRTLEILLTKVESISVDQSILGRLLGYGSIQVSGTGSSAQLFVKIGSPLRFRQQVQEQATAAQART